MKDKNQNEIKRFYWYISEQHKTKCDIKTERREPDRDIQLNEHAELMCAVTVLAVTFVAVTVVAVTFAVVAAPGDGTLKNSLLL